MSDDDKRWLEDKESNGWVLPFKARWALRLPVIRTVRAAWHQYKAEKSAYRWGLDRYRDGRAPVRSMGDLRRRERLGMNDIDWLSCRRIERMRDAEDVLDVLCEKFGNESRLALVRIFHSATAPRAKEQANLTEKADV